jgi:uncharacterized protein
MPETITLTHPWLIAVWPGMGHIAISAGYYLLAKLEMQLVAEFSPRELFEVEHVEVKDGIIQMGRLPRSRFFVWRDPNERHDIIVFLGEAQPPIGKYAFCHRLIDFAKQLGVERVFTFAAMATAMRPEQPSRVFAAATDKESLAELEQMDLTILRDGNIGGMNGVCLGVAAENSMRGSCLLGEMPQLFAQFPFPKAAQRVLEVFTKIAGIQVDFTELAEQAAAVEEKLAELLGQVESQIEQQREAADEEEPIIPPSEPRLNPEDERRIEELFTQAGRDRSKAYELKRELDRLEIFKDYEDRFLDLFKPKSV